MLAMMALEATTHALQYDGPSTIYVADKELAGWLDNIRVKWGSVKDPASRVLRMVFRKTHARIRYEHHEAINRVGPDPEQDVVHQGCWLAGQVAAGQAMEELSSALGSRSRRALVLVGHATAGERWGYLDMDGQGLGQVNIGFLSGGSGPGDDGESLGA